MRVDERAIAVSDSREKPASLKVSKKGTCHKKHVSSGASRVMIAFHQIILMFLVGFAQRSRGAGVAVDSSPRPQDKGKTLQCLNLLYAEGGGGLNISSQQNLSHYQRLWQTTSSYRFVGVCRDDPSRVGVLLEMQAHFSILYKDKDGKTRCRIVKLAPLVSPLGSKHPINAIHPEMPVPLRGATQEEEKPPGSGHRIGSSAPVPATASSSTPTTAPILPEFVFTMCDNMTRSLRLYLDPQLPQASPQPWQLKMTWTRKPEHYEVGEVGWSSVGAHIGALSGTFSLTRVRLDFSVRGFEGVHAAQAAKELVAQTANISRFRARSGDYYQCATDRQIDLQTHRSILSSSTDDVGDQLASSDSTENEEVDVVLTTRHLRLQTFSDFDANHFSGSGVTCREDIHEDNSVTVGLGVTVCVVVVISVVAVVLTRLYDRDKELQTYEQEYLNMTNRTFLQRGNHTTAKSETWPDASPA